MSDSPEPAESQVLLMTEMPLLLVLSVSSLFHIQQLRIMKNLDEGLLLVCVIIVYYSCLKPN